MKREPLKIIRDLRESVSTKPDFYAGILLIVNFLFRVTVFKTTTLFRFSDYTAYLDAVIKLQTGEKVYLLNGNFLFAISYLGYFAEKLGSFEIFFVFNCLLGTTTGLVIYILLKRVTGSAVAGLVSLVILTLYTEYVVFSSVFYTPVIMIFLVSLLLLSLWYYITVEKGIWLISAAFSSTIILIVTFFFKPELKYFPYFLIIFSSAFYFIGLSKKFLKRILLLSIMMVLSNALFNYSGLLTHPEDNVIANDFVFFGHTDYGGDGGEGAFIYPENKERYEKAWKMYCMENNIT
ncbi:MAG: hypothetical protein ACUVTX_10225, partial [Bacteroidales bacterium]